MHLRYPFTTVLESLFEHVLVDVPDRVGDVLGSCNKGCLGLSGATWGSQLGQEPSGLGQFGAVWGPQGRHSKATANLGSSPIRLSRIAVDTTSTKNLQLAHFRYYSKQFSFRFVDSMQRQLPTPPTPKPVWIDQVR